MIHHMSDQTINQSIILHENVWKTERESYGVKFIVWVTKRCILVVQLGYAYGYGDVMATDRQHQ